MIARKKIYNWRSYKNFIILQGRSDTLLTGFDKRKGGGGGAEQFLTQSAKVSGLKMTISDGICR